MKMLWMLALIMLPASLRSQSTAATPSPLFQTVTGSFFALSVSDLEASARWYAEKFGMKVVMDVPTTGGTAIKVLEGGGLIVELITHASAVVATTKPQDIHGIFKVGLVVGEFDETVARLRARGIPIAFGPFPARGRQRANVVIRDNAGTLIQVFGR